jgi:hypothetical protein
VVSTRRSTSCRRSRALRLRRASILHSSYTSLELQPDLQGPACYNLRPAQCPPPVNHYAGYPWHPFGSSSCFPRLSGPLPCDSAHARQIAQTVHPRTHDASPLPVLGDIAPRCQCLAAPDNPAHNFLERRGASSTANAQHPSPSWLLSPRLASIPRPFSN